MYRVADENRSWEATRIQAGLGGPDCDGAAASIDAAGRDICAEHDAAKQDERAFYTKRASRSLSGARGSVSIKNGIRNAKEPAVVRCDGTSLGDLTAIQRLIPKK